MGHAAGRCQRHDKELTVAENVRILVLKELTVAESVRILVLEGTLTNSATASGRFFLPRALAAPQGLNAEGMFEICLQLRLVSSFALYAASPCMQHLH